ncbi:MAG: phosphoribosylglycinamide formyltransferase [Pseudomonadota bacterium]
MSGEERLPIVVLISGGGTNLQAIIQGTRADLPVDIRAVISNSADAYGLVRARDADIATRIVDHRQFAARADHDHALRSAIDAYAPALVVLAGYMRILTADFVRHYRGRMLNIHPSLLPKFRGLKTHERAIEAGETEHGASVHFVTEDLDGGPVIIQARVPVEAGDTPQSLAARVLEKEHIIFPLTIRWFAEGRLRLEGNRVVLDGRVLEQPVQLETLPEADRV